MRDVTPGSNRVLTIGITEVVLVPPQLDHSPHQSRERGVVRGSFLLTRGRGGSPALQH